MSKVKQFVTSGIMVLFALALTIMYIPINLVSIVDVGNIAELTGGVLGIALNAVMCIGAWLIALKASYTGARMVRVCNIIKQCIGWIGLAGAVLSLIASLGSTEWTDYPELNALTVIIYLLVLVGIAATVTEIFIARNISGMMKDIMYRMSGGRSHGFLVTLDNWSVAAIVIVGIVAVLIVVAMILVGRMFGQLGLSIVDLPDMGLEYGSIAATVYDMGAQIFAYIVFIRLSRSFCRFVTEDNAEKDAIDRGEDLPAETDGENG